MNDSSINNSLKPCPFCGSPAEIEQYEESGATHIRCSANNFVKISCEFSPCSAWYYNPENAYKAWNTRNG